MVDFISEYLKKKEIVEDYLENDLIEDNVSYKTLISAMKYSVKAGGKRIRPILMMASYELFKDDSENILPFCCAIEYIHTYSLIHDDLPAMDNDDLRRGLPTCHKKYSEAIAILAGDALLNYAYEKMINSELPYSWAAMKTILSAAGKNGMIGGQVIDIESEGKEISLKLLNELHALKTGALIRASCISGATLAGASSDDIELLGEFGSLIGMAFQIKDDILDKISSEDMLGKPVGSDEKNKKTTYLSHFSVEECENMIKELTARANYIIDHFDKKGLFMKQLADYLLNRVN